MTPKEAITKTMRERMRGDYGHDLPDDHFWIDADEILEGLKNAGFLIVAGGQGQVSTVGEIGESILVDALPWRFCCRGAAFGDAP